MHSAKGAVHMTTNYESSAYEHAKDFWDKYYTDDEIYRISDPEEHIQARLIEQDPAIHPLQARWLGHAARDSIVERLQLD